jgi:hypothetical protein
LDPLRPAQHRHEPDFLSGDARERTRLCSRALYGAVFAAMAPGRRH